MRWTRIGGTAALVAALAIGLALSVGLWGSWTASAQDTFIVNDDTTPADGGCGTPDFETEDIEDAIDSGLVADGDTLVICEGTYTPPSDISVNKRLTIEGRAGADRDDIVVQISGGWDAFSIWADGVTIRHLKLVGDPTLPPGEKGVGIYVMDNRNANTIRDVEITDWYHGVVIGTGAKGNVVETSNIHTNDVWGIRDYHSENTVIRSNEITDNTHSGINMDSVDGTLVDANVLSGNDVAQIEMTGRTLVRIVRNEIEASSNGIYIKEREGMIVPAEALIEIGGSDANANTFDGDLEPDMYYIQMDCTSEATVDATHNYWKGSPVVSRGVSGVIFNDEDDDPADPGADCPGNDDGAVVFHPTASGPAPTPTPSPTPSPTATATATGTPTPTATPGATRTIDLSPAGWHDPVWSGPDATDPGTALACISGKYSIAYAWESPTTGFKRHVEGCPVPGICNMAPLNKYDALLVNITADASCTMAIAP